MNVDNPHDRFFKESFPERTFSPIDFLRLYLPEPIRQGLDLYWATDLTKTEMVAIF